MAPYLGPPSWVHATEGPEMPPCWRKPLPPWRPAGRQSAWGTSPVFLSQGSRPTSSTCASLHDGSDPSSYDAGDGSERPHSAPVRRPTSARRSRPPTASRSRPSSAAQPIPEQRPASATKAPRRPVSAPAAPRPTSARRRFRSRQTTDPSQLSTSVESMAIPSKFSIYTDHGLSDDEIERTPLQELVPNPWPVDAASEDTCGSSSAAGEIGEEVPTVPEDQATPHDAAKVLRTGQVRLGILDVTIAERPLYAELTLGGLERCMQSSVPGRWPPMAETLTFDLDDLRVEQVLSVRFWTSVGEGPEGPGRPAHPKCVACGKTNVLPAAAPREVTVTLEVQHLSGQLQRGVARLHMEVVPPKPDFDIFDHSDVHCSRNLLLSRRFRGRYYRGLQEPPMGPTPDRVVDVSQRCWSYLEHRSSALKLRRQTCHQRIRAAKALRAGPPAVSKRTPKLARVSSEQAFRLQRYLRSVVKGTQHGSQALAKVASDGVVEAAKLQDFLEQTLGGPELSPDDDAALRALLMVDGQLQMQTLLKFLDFGAAVVPTPQRVIYPDEQRARDILKEMFPGFLDKEQQREMELHAT